MKTKRSPLNAPRKLRELLTLPEVAAELGSSRRFIEQEANRGRLRIIRFSARLVRVRREDLDSYITFNASGAVTGGPSHPGRVATGDGREVGGLNE